MLLKEVLGEFAAVAHNGDGFDSDLFAVIDEVNPRVQERLAVRKVDLARSRLPRQCHTALRFDTW